MIVIDDVVWMSGNGLMLISNDWENFLIYFIYFTF